MLHCIAVPRGEKPSLCDQKNEMEDFGRSDNLLSRVMTMSGALSTNKLRGVKRVAASELRRPQPAQAVPTKPEVNRPQLLSDRVRVLGERRKIEKDDALLETFTLPLEAARLTVRDVINDMSQRGYQKIVDRWRQLPDGQIEFTVRHLPIGD
jgi:hypothetical protein